jgi:2-aminoethylphosphonate dioxygenase
MKAILDSEFAHWERQGYLWIKGHLSTGEVAELSNWVEQLAAWPETPGKWMKWYEQARGQRQLCRVEDFLPYHAAFAEFLQRGTIASILERLFGEPARLFKEKINFKLAGGAGFQPHQDAPAFTTFGQRYHVTLMVSIDPATRENGCLEVVDGYHGAGLLPQAEDGTLEHEWVDRQIWKPVETAPGDLLFFDSYVPHRSGPNRSDRPRRALYVTYNRASEGDYRAEYFARKRAAFPPECERVAGHDYSSAAALYNLGNPIT